MINSFSSSVICCRRCWILRSISSLRWVDIRTKSSCWLNVVFEHSRSCWYWFISCKIYMYNNLKTKYSHYSVFNLQKKNKNFYLSSVYILQTFLSLLIFVFICSISWCVCSIFNWICSCNCRFCSNAVKQRVNCCFKCS